MKVCIYGVGAVGRLIGARLAAVDGVELSAIARGATLAAIGRHGLRVQSGGAMTSRPIRAVEEPSALGVQDVVVLAVKGPALAAVVPRIGPLLGHDTIVVTAMNGVPWWFFEGVSGPHSGMRLESVDPGGAMSRAIPVRHVIGCALHLAVALPEPGRVVPQTGNLLVVGEPDGRTSPRIERVAHVLTRAGFDVRVSNNIRRDIWYKLWGNLTMNPIAAITGASSERILADPLVARFMAAAMREASAIGARIGCAIDETPEQRTEVARKLGPFRPSMLQDAESGRPLEIDGIVAVVKEIGERVGVATPNIDALLGLARLFGRVRGLYPEAT